VSAEAFPSPSNVVEPVNSWGSTPDHAGGAYSAPQTPQLEERAGCPLPKNLTLALGPSDLKPLGLRPLISRPLSWNPEYAPVCRQKIKLKLHTLGPVSNAV